MKASPLLLLALCSFPGLAQAQSITLDNFDFTTPSTGGAGPNDYILAANNGTDNVTTIPSFSFTNSESVGGLQYDNRVPVAVNQVAFQNNVTNDGVNYPVNTITYIDALPQIASGTNYTLTVSLGMPGGGSDADYTLELLDNGATVASGSINSTLLPTLPATTGYTGFYDFTVTLPASTIDQEALAGGDLGFALGSSLGTDAGTSAFSQSYFSDVRLSAVAVPEPGIDALAVFGAGLLGLTVRRRSR